MSDEIFSLTDGERTHPLWLRMKEHFEYKLSILRKRNDNAKLTEAETAALRGEIAALRAIVALGDDRPQTE